MMQRDTARTRGFAIPNDRDAADKALAQCMDALAPLQAAWTTPPELDKDGSPLPKDGYDGCYRQMPPGDWQDWSDIEPDPAVVYAWVNQYLGDLGPGYVLFGEVMVDGVAWWKCLGYGPETDRERDWYVAAPEAAVTDAAVAQEQVARADGVLLPAGPADEVVA